MSKVEFLMTSNLENVDVSSLETIKEEYYDLLGKNKFPKPPESGVYFEMINYFKRKNEMSPNSIGPYRNITPFEAANRIASDLVIINGLFQLIEARKLINPVLTIRLGTTHLKDKGDFTIRTGLNEFEGEAFNVAPSFLKGKLNQTFKKWKTRDDRLAYILINEDAFEYVDPEKLNKKIFIVKNWSIKTDYLK